MAGNFILLNSCTGINLASIHRKITIYRGALIEKTSSGYLYQHRRGLAGSKFRAAVRYHIITDVKCKELDQCQFELLSGISEDESRYQVYATGRLEWGCSMKSGDNIFVKFKQRGIDRPVAATICCKKENVFGVVITDPDYKVDRAPINDSSKNFITQAKKMSIDAYVALDKLYNCPDQISDQISDDEGEDNSTAQSNTDAPKLKYLTLDQSCTHSSMIEISINPRVFEEVKNSKPECKEFERKTAAQEESHYIKKLEQEIEHVNQMKQQLDLVKEERDQMEQERDQLEQERDQMKQLRA